MMIQAKGCTKQTYNGFRSSVKEIELMDEG